MIIHWCCLVPLLMLIAGLLSIEGPVKPYTFKYVSLDILTKFKFSNIMLTLLRLLTQLLLLLLLVVVLVRCVYILLKYSIIFIRMLLSIQTIVQLFLTSYLTKNDR